MDQLLIEIVNLEDQERIFEQQLANAETDEEGRQITNELNIVRNKLSEKKEELRILKEKEDEKQAVIEYKVQSEGIPFAVSDIDFAGVPVEVITLIEKVVHVDRRRLLKEHAAEVDQFEKKHADAASDYETRISQLQYRVDAMEDIIDAGKAENAQLIRDNGTLRDHTAQQQLEIQDLRSKLANASAQLEEKDAEIARLNSQIDDYQRAKVFGEREAQKIIDLTPQENNDINAAVDAVKKLYDRIEDWGSIQKVVKPDGTFELATRQEVAEQWEAADGHSSFRGEAAETHITAPEVAPAVEVPVPDITFHTETERGDNQDADGQNVGAVLPEATLEERVAKLEQAVFGWQAVA